jgi:hypothetical protein
MAIYSNYCFTEQVDDNWCVKVCDFGLTLVKKNEEKANYGAIGTPLWMVSLKTI